MKKWLIILLSILIITGLIYLLVPGSLVISKTAFLNTPKAGLYRAMMDENNWKSWWPDSSDKSESKFTLNNNTYSISRKTISSLFIDINNGKSNTKSSLTFLPLSLDSVKIQWDVILNTSNNPINRIQAYFRYRQLKKDIDILFERISSHYSVVENVYGIKVENQSVVDSLLVFISENSSKYPTTKRIYELIASLKKFIAAKSAKETGYPMLNITTEDSINWVTKVAVPVDRLLEPSGNITYRKMLGGGNILVAEVKGGPVSITTGFRKLENYVSDYDRISPAIPFQSLITDRSTESDTSKWITRIYYPVM